ncbi:interferon beta-like [Malaclemys terrapin pileata]|uniref:interferon beta-like n=1 Tax=Malaclemys terrapin pileata TaxID=2991368 RepID=UPI0023A7D7E2|nr:interferon beta-like [Malaclemys terrapin pileata]
MTSSCLLHVCLVLLFSTEISSRLCTMLHFQQNKVNKESLELLQKMSGNFPSQCINERMAFKPTQDVVQLPVSQKENAKVAIQEILQQIFNIFSKNLTQSAWDGTSIVRFQNGLYQQIQRLEACLRAQMEKELTNPESEDLQLTSRRVKKYFQGIDAFLKEKQYSLCAWEIVRTEIPRSFVLIDKLIRSLSN